MAAGADETARYDDTGEVPHTGTQSHRCTRTDLSALLRRQVAKVFADGILLARRCLEDLLLVDAPLVQLQDGPARGGQGRRRIQDREVACQAIGGVLRGRHGESARKIPYWPTTRGGVIIMLS